MNIAILLDDRENNEITPRTLLHGQEMYLYSLKQLLINPKIDAVAMVWKEAGTAQYVYDRIMNPEELGAAEKEKKIWIFHDAGSLPEITEYINKDINEEVETYIFHSIRYPLVTQKMIENVMKNVKKSGIAVTTEKIADELIQINNQMTFPNEKYRTVRYPIAVNKDHEILKELRDYHNILQKVTDFEVTMCEAESRNISVDLLEDWEMAESLIRIREDRRGAGL